MMRIAMPPPVAVGSATDLYSLSGTIEHARLSWTYRAGLVVVAIAMLILPLLYLGLIGAVGAAVWWHLTANTWIAGAGSFGLWRLIAYLGPAIAGVVLVFFMIKPVLARPARQVDPIPIQPDAEPDLVEFVTRICEEVHAPVPSRIQVDCKINASASFSSMPALLRPRFVLTIGLPLAAGLTVRQLGGILAHEFGHFAQGGGMRLTYLIRSINAWFGRVVGERDQWDDKLERWIKDSDGRIAIILAMAQVSIWCSRLVLHGLMLIGHGISCFMTRQMEFDADSYEIELVGTATFVETFARLRELNVGARVGYAALKEGWVRRTLPSDLPAFLLDRCARMPQELATQVREIPDAKTALFDTHPADVDRVRAAEQANASGVLEGGGAPATMLFRDFDALSAAATRHHYEHELRLSLESATLVDTDVAVAAGLVRQKGYEAARTFFGEHVSLLRPVPSRLPGLESLTATELIDKLLEARRAMSANATSLEPYRKFEEFDRKLTLAQAAQLLLESGFSTVPAADFGLPEGTRAGADETEGFAITQLRSLEPAVQRLDDIAATRLACALALLDHRVLDLEADSRAELRRQVARLSPSLVAFADAWPHVHQIERLLLAGGLVRANLERSPNPDATSVKVTAIVDRIRVLLGRVRTAIGDAEGPDDGPGGPRRLVTLLALESTLDTELKAPNAVRAAASLRMDVIGRLCAVALQVEAAVDRGRT